MVPVVCALCRGAISDFHPVKAKIVESPCDPICLRINEDDIFGDGNNFMVRTHSHNYVLGSHCNLQPV